MRVIGLLEEDIQNLAEAVNLMSDFSDKEAERKKVALRLLEDFRKHLAALKDAHG